MAPKEGELLTLRDRSVLDEEDEQLEVRDRAIEERQLRKKNYQGVDFDADEAKTVAQQASAEEGVRMQEEVLVYQSEFQSEEVGNFKKTKSRKRKLEEPDETLDDYYADILPRKPKISKDPKPEVEASTRPVERKIGNLDWLDNLPEAEAPKEEIVEELEISAPQGGGSAVLQEEPLDESATSFIRLLRRRGLLKPQDEELVFQDKRGREFKGKQVFKEISRRFRGARGGMKKRI